MNKQQRVRLSNIITELRELLEEEQDKHNNMPESFQLAEQGERMQAGIDAIESAIDALEGIE